MNFKMEVISIFMIESYNLEDIEKIQLRINCLGHKDIISYEHWKKKKKKNEELAHGFSV